MASQSLYQISTLQALAMGYSRRVITVEELLEHGDTGLGTFEDLNGEMILADGKCFRAEADGRIVEADAGLGIPFAAVTYLQNSRRVSVNPVLSLEELRIFLDLRIEEEFGLNSMHVVRIDGVFEKICARSELPFKSQHVRLKEILGRTQRDFCFDAVSGILICVYFPDYMDGINAPGWHFHFISDDQTRGGHVFDLVMKQGTAEINKISRIEIRLPETPAFDTYSLTDTSQDEIREVEQSR